MEDLYMTVVTGPPAQSLRPVFTTEYTILRAQAQTPLDRVKLLLKRLSTASEASAAQTTSLLLNECIGASLGPDDVESMVESLVGFAKDHPEWEESIRWICALIHFYCTDEVTVSIFAEFEVPSVAVDALAKFPENSTLCAGAAALLSHFNFYSIGDGIARLVAVIKSLNANIIVCRIACRALAEFTSYYKGSADLFQEACSLFVNAGGVEVVECVLRQHITDEDTSTYTLRILANITSANLDSVVSSDSAVIGHVNDVLCKYPNSEMLCCHALRVIGNVPRSTYIDMGVIANIIQKTTSEMVVQEGMRALSSIAMNSKEVKGQVHTTGCIPHVLDFMKKYRHNPFILEEACSLLSYLSFDSEAITASITTAGGITCVLEAMQAFPANENLLTTACAALSGLTFNNFAGQQVVANENGVERIIDAMKCGTKARLLENGCLAIGTMCWNSDLKADVVRLGGVKAIMKALDEQYQSSGLVKNACRALAQIAFNCERYRDMMSANGVIPLIIRGMAHHPNYDRAQMHGCVALSYLSWTSEANAAHITAHSGYKVIVDAMRFHPNNHEVQEHACRALANISTVDYESSAAALEQIVAAMRRHDRVSEVQEEACRAIVTLSLVSPKNKNKLFELNGAEQVVEAMKAFPKIPLVQQEGCNALAHLAYEHANLNKQVTDLGGVELLLTAMKTHTSNPKVQLNACGGLSALAFDNTVAQRQIFELGGVDCVIRAMSTFERLRMLELGCSVLGTLAWNTDIKEQVAVVAIPEILTAMRVHQASPLLQKSTCRAVSQFAFNSEKNRQLLADSGAIPLIITAMRTHLATEKLIIHALKALTYLCWENTQVAQAIIDGGISEVLEQILLAYPNKERVSNEAIHLFKILFRKSTGNPSPVMKTPFSPPTASPVGVMQTPGGPPTGAAARKVDTTSYSPVVTVGQEDDDLDKYYNAPRDAAPQPGVLAQHLFSGLHSDPVGEGGGRRRRPRRRGADGAVEVAVQSTAGGEEGYFGQGNLRYSRFAGEGGGATSGSGGRGGGGRGGASSPLLTEFIDPAIASFEDPRFPKRSGPRVTSNKDGMWDEPVNFHGLRTAGPSDLNWQQQELARGSVGAMGHGNSGAAHSMGGVTSSGGDSHSRGRYGGGVRGGGRGEGRGRNAPAGVPSQAGSGGGGEGEAQHPHYHNSNNNHNHAQHSRGAGAGAGGSAHRGGGGRTSA